MADMITNGLHGCSAEETYVWPQDPLLLERLEWFQDQKLGFMTHFGPCCQAETDSWVLSDEDASWSRAVVNWKDDPADIRQEYIELYKSFNPVRFQPEEWAEFAAENGFKYFLPVTKHHDGFCLFDSAYTDYKVTNPDCPFHTHKYADITRAAFDAFRKKGLGISAYFSKPDWNCPWYWAEGMERPVGFNRNPTYDIAKHPDIWEKYVEFTHNQIMELIEKYGKIDVLWLDGGQVRPDNGQDIRLSEVVARARKVQPWLLVADRTVGGENENFITPEQSIPDQTVRVPWESCVTVGTKWAFKYSDNYKSSRTLVHMLIQTVSRGGNLALNVGPQPDGRLPAEAMKEISGLGAWLRVNGDAIYGTRAVDGDPQIGNVAFTKKGNAVYAHIILQEEDILFGLVQIPWSGNVEKVTNIATGQEMSFVKTNDELSVSLPEPICGKDIFVAVFCIQ